MATPSTMAPMPSASRENCPLMKYIMESPNKAPKATGSMSNGIVFQLRIHINSTTRTITSDHAIVEVRSPLMVDEL